MLIKGWERNQIRRDMQRARGDFRRVYLLLATLTDCTESGCGFDEMTQAGKNPTCTTCEGTGKSVSWKVQEIRARIKIFDFVQLQGAGAAPPGVELGDVALYIRIYDETSFQSVDDNKASYVYIEGDGYAYRPFSITADGVGQKDEVRVILRKATVERRKTGY